jgi:hypothetical protein
MIAFLSVAAVSCTKSDLSKLTAEPAPITDPFIYSKIEKTIAEPSEMELGTAGAIIQQGQRVTIFLPYSIANETLVNAKMTMTDDATGLVINTYDLIPSTDAAAAQLTLPTNIIINHSEFFFITFVADESYAGKTVSITTMLEGQVTYSNDVLNAAFSVIP